MSLNEHLLAKILHMKTAKTVHMNVYSLITVLH